jgi:fermentation-respiration switch protein FrsA (DUF1100 family)
MQALALGTLLGGCSSFLYFPSRGVYSDPARAGYPPEDVTFTSADGTKLHGWYFKGRGRRPAPALVVQFHGNAENLTTHFANLIWLVDEGYDLFTFDYRGYGSSEGQPNPEGTVRDGLAALAWAKVRGKPLIVYGQSLGGAVALRSVGEWEDRAAVKLIVAESTFRSYRSVGRSVLRKSWVTWPFQWLSYLVLSDAWGPARTLERLPPIPLLVIHGDADTVVVPQMGRDLFADAREPKEFLNVPGGGHTNSFWIENGRYRPWLK